MSYDYDTDKSFAELIRWATTKQRDGDSCNDDELDNLSSYIHPRYKARWEQLIDTRFAISLDVTDEQLCAYDTDAVSSIRQTDSDYYRPASVGIKKRVGSGDRVRTLDQERKYQMSRTKLKTASVARGGDILSVTHYDPLEGLVSWIIDVLTWDDVNNRWRHDTSGYNKGIKLVPIKWRADHVRRVLYITYQGKRVYAHHLAWHLHYGSPPPGNLRFVDGNPGNLTITNIALVATGPKKPYVARARLRGKMTHLGSYATIQERDEAVKAFNGLKQLGLV